MNRTWSIVILVGLLLMSNHLFGQSVSRELKRQEIEAKRIGLNFSDREALPLGRSFKRLDSTYYVGWMYEGAYLMEHSADAMGFQIAGQVLEKALHLLETDFKEKLYTRTEHVSTYLNVANIHRDWDFIQYALYQCYANANEITKAWEMLRQASNVDLQDEFMTETYNLMAWTVHRNRLFTTNQYSFLKKNIQENEDYAQALLDSSLLKLKRDQSLMKSFLAIDYLKERQPGIWHYKAMLYGYQLNIKTADSFYQLLRETPFFPENNFATFKLIQGQFDSAQFYYDQAKRNENTDKRLKESYYYNSIINGYANTIQNGISEINELIKANGTTPGFGWYQLALARLYLNNGQLFRAGQAINKAAHFHELHIGTTLGAVHYQITLSTLRLMYWTQCLNLQQFSDRYWFFKPDKIFNTIQWKWNRYKEKLHWIELIKNNPEREQVLYQLFSSESTIGFNEFLVGIELVSPAFFEKKFKESIKNDSLRPALKPYWQYALAQQYLQQKKWKLAKIELLNIVQRFDSTKQTSHHRMLLGKTYPALIMCLEKLNEPIPMAYYTAWFVLYPQFIPQHTLNFPFKLSYLYSPELKPILKAIRSSHCEISNESNIPELRLKCAKQGNTFRVIGQWFLPNSQQAFRTCSWKVKNEAFSNEAIFQPLFNP